ncbi:MAG: hypothetical protein MZV70_49025 [Desulfobacterales bacterium]|nr:hypothetical protein [Desulfobacterales bacterium]
MAVLRELAQEQPGRAAGAGKDRARCAHPPGRRRAAAGRRRSRMGASREEIGPLEIGMAVIGGQVIVNGLQHLQAG